MVQLLLPEIAEGRRLAATCWLKREIVPGFVVGNSLRQL